MRKMDKQRINIDYVDFTKIKFSNFGLPEIMIRLYAFLAQEDPLELGIKKAEQTLS